MGYLRLRRTSKIKQRETKAKKKFFFDPLVTTSLIYACIKLVGKLSGYNLSLCGALKISFLSRVSCLNCLYHKLFTGVIMIRNS